MAEAKKAMANIVFEDIDTFNAWSKGTLTGKFLQWLPLKTPILSIARKDNEMGAILERTDKGRLTDNVRGVLEFLESIKHADRNFSGKQEAINFYSKKNQAAILCGYLGKIINQNYPEK